MAFFKKIKISANKFLKKLEDENKKSFGKKGLDCCELNKKD